jgi:hypothetical protein
LGEVWRRHNKRWILQTLLAALVNETDLWVQTEIQAAVS